MYSLLTLLPLAAGDEKIMNMTKTLTDFATGDMTAAFSNIGRGIGGIMLLIVALYYITSILDGGKFQLKMLLPLLIFILVCNFSWVSGPVTSFTQTITSSLVSACERKKASINEKNGCLESANINDLNNAKMDTRKDGEQVEQLLGNTEAATQKKDDSSIDEEGASSTNKNGGGENWKVRMVKGGIMSAGRQASYDFQVESSGENIVEPASEKKGRKLGLQNLGWQGIISSVISWICQIMSAVLSAFGAVMTGIIVAFGPITFGFAVFPGQGRNILSWFLRLCQFALWAPICALIDVFSVMIFDTMASSTMTAGSLAMAIAVAVCNLVALTSVPTIASMIIEGAQGAVSLSQGLQSMAGAMTAGGSAAAAVMSVGKGMTTAAIGTNAVQGIRDAVSGAKQGGVIGAIKDIRYSDGLKDLAKSWSAAGRKSRQGNFGNYTGFKK